MVEDLGESIDATAARPAARHLFDVNKDCPKLTGKYAEVFHSVTAKNLYTTKRIRPDVETTVLLLCTSVTNSYEDD